MTRQEQSRRFRQALRTLTERERECLSLRCKGMTNKAVGTALFVSEQAIKNHITNVLRKLRPEIDAVGPWSVSTTCWRLGYETALLDVQTGIAELEEAA